MFRRPRTTTVATKEEATTLTKRPKMDVLVKGEQKIRDDDGNDDLEERKRSARATVSLSIASVALLWLGSLSACDTLVASAMTTKEETSSLERVAVALERLVKEAREQKGRHERCVRRSWKGCEKTLENEIGKEEERARLARKENEDVVARLANATRKAERERWKCWRRT